MKLLVLTALVATCTCWSLTRSVYEDKEDFSPTHNKFTSGNEYEYKYESQVMTGLPTFTRQYAGVKILCDIKIAFESATSCMMQMSNVKVMSLNSEVMDPSSLPPYQQLPADLFTPLPSEESSLIVKKLMMPIKFRYDKGKVSSIEVTTEETNWSVDMKRAVLGLMQVKLQSDDKRVMQTLPYNKVQQENITTFDVLEAGLEGNCYSAHHVYLDMEEPEDNKVYKVIKARDLSRCIKLNNIDKDVYPQRQVNCDCRENMNNKDCVCAPVANMWNTSGSSYNKLRTDYELLSDDAETFIIRKAVQAVEYRMESPQSPSQYLLTNSNQTLVMVDQRNQISIDTSRFSWKQVSEPWKMQILEEESLMMTVDQLMQNIRKILNEIVTVASQPERFDDHILLFQQLVENVRLCKKNQLNSIFAETKHSGKDNKEWKVFLDALRTVNTTEADTLLLTKIMSQEIPKSEALPILMVWTADKVPTRTILDMMLTTILPSMQTDQTKKDLYAHCMMCFGAMVRRYIHSEEMKMGQCVLPADKSFHQNNIEECRKYEKYIEGRLSVARTDEAKIMLMKVIANIGNIKSLPMLQRFLSPTESLAVRVHTIWAFNKFGIQNKMKTLQTLLPIMLHHHQDTELRVAAFIMVMKCNPSTSLWEVQKHLNDERDLEFKSFVVKYLKNMLERREPQCEQSQMRIRQILKSIRAFQMSVRTFDFQLMYGLRSGEGNGDILRFSTIANTTSEIPRSATIRQSTRHNHAVYHFLEVGYRGDRIERLFRKLSGDDDAPVSGRDSFRLVNNKLLKPVPSAVGQPSITFYVKMLGQQIAFAHFDERTIMMLRRVMDMDDGAVEIPISLFKTIMLKPREVRTLQPFGGWLESVVGHGIVIDVEGVIRLQRNGEDEMPTIELRSTKPIRFEVRTFYSQSTNMGFTKAGLTSAIGSRLYLKAEQTVFSYNMHQKMYSKNFTNPDTNQFGHFDVKATTYTFLMPARLPEILTSRQMIVKEIKVDESGRRQISSDWDWLKSVQLRGRLEGDVNMPELYTFIRDRMHLLPTNLCIYKQHLRLTIKPVSQQPCKVCLLATSQFFVPTEADTRDVRKLTDDSEESEESKGFFSSLFGSDKDSSEEDIHENTEIPTQRFMHPQTLGSLWHKYGVSLASESERNTFNMSANLTTYYEHDYPTTRAILKMVRPPIPSTGENQRMMFIDQVTTTVNPGTNEVLSSHKMQWGPKSQPEQHTITVTLKLRPNYKDNVCHEQTVYGCKDDYGVVYPIWYNNTMHVEYKNTKVPEIIRQKLEPMLMNLAESVYMYPWEGSKTARTMDFHFIVRPDELKNDYIIQDTNYVMNISRLYDPVGTKIHNYIAQRQYPHSKIDTLTGADIVPFHHLLNPFATKRDICVYQNPKVYMFDKKTLHLPKSDCEVILAGDCSRGDKKMLVSVIPSTELSVPKALKVLLGSKRIQMNINKWLSRQEIEVMVNEQVQKMDDQRRLVVQESGRDIATLECYDDRCQLLSKPYGVYVNLDWNKLSVEVDSEKSDYMCGLCAQRPEIQKDDLSSETSMTIFRQNINTERQCDVRKPVTLSGLSVDKCVKLNKYRLVTTMDDKNGSMMHCVTRDHQSICSESCKHKARHMVDVMAKCVTVQQAKEIGLLRMQKLEGGEFIIENENIVQQMKSKGKDMQVKIQKYNDCRL